MKYAYFYPKNTDRIDYRQNKRIAYEMLILGFSVPPSVMRSPRKQREFLRLKRGWITLETKRTLSKKP